VNYLYSVKQDRLLQAVSDPKSGQTQDKEQTYAAREAAEKVFQ